MLGIVDVIIIFDLSLVKVEAQSKAVVASGADCFQACLASCFDNVTCNLVQASNSMLCLGLLMSSSFLTCLL